MKTSTRIHALALALLGGLTAIAPPANAQIVAEPVSPYPNPDQFARGFFLQGEAGATIPLGAARDTMSTGPSLGMRAGYEFARWVALQAALASSTHSLDATAGPQVAQLLQLTHVTAELRLAIPIGAWSIFGQGGAGRARLSTNILGTTGLTDPGIRVSLVYGGSAGVDYHTRSRHFSCGLTTGFTKLPAIKTTGTLTTSLYLRHAF